MKRMLLIFATVALFGLVFIPQTYAQDPDTLEVPTVINDNPLGAINKFIKGDTTDTGERKNPNRVYLLKRGQVYFVNGPITVDNFHLRLIGEKEDPANPMKPAVIAPGILPNGNVPGLTMMLRGDATIKNVYFMGKAPNGVAQGRIIRVLKDSVRVVIDNCHFEWCRWINIQVQALHTKLFVTNCFFRNSINANAIFNGRQLQVHAYTDTVVMVNNTAVNNNSYFFNAAQNGVKYCRIEHNTVVNGVIWPTNFPNSTNYYLLNNIFYNTHAYGYDDATLETANDGQPPSIANTDTLTEDLLAEFGITEQERVFQVHNNAYFWDQKLYDFWNSVDTVHAALFMNERTKGMFNDPETWPNFSESNNQNKDPQFVNAPPNVDKLIQYVSDKRSTGTAGYLWGWDPDGDEFGIEWPLPEDLSYTNADLLTAADGGFPVGDLNWFPDKKAEWEAWMATSVSSGSGSAVPADFTLAQNYPNPFNPETTIEYALRNSGQVTLTIYNTLGQTVRRLVDKKQTTGAYQVRWDARNDNGEPVPSGIYYYKLQVGKQSLVGKMALMR